MNDLDITIRRGLERLADAARPPGAASDDILAALDERRRSRQRARRRASRFTVVVLIGAAAAVAYAVVDRGADESQVVTDPAPVVDPTPTTEPELDPDPEVAETVTGAIGSEAPLTPRDHVAAVWTGSELVLWGGTSPDQNDGAAYDPVGDTWRSIPPAPIDTSPQRWSRAVWTGDEVVVFHGRSAAAWDPRSNGWRELPDAPGEVGHVVWTGDEVIVTRMSISDRQSDVAGALDPAGGTWRELPSVGRLDELTITWTGDELIALGRNVENPGLGIEGRALDSVTDTWRELSRGPIEARGYGAAWVGDRIVVTNYHSEAASYDPLTDTWTELPMLPVGFGEEGAMPIAAGDQDVVIVEGGGLLTVGNRTGAWVPAVHAGAPGINVAAGPHLVLHVSVGTYRGGRLDRHAPRADVHRLDGLLNPSVLQIGAGVLTLSDRVELMRVDAVGEPPMLRGANTHVLVDGAECRVRVEFGAGVIGVPGGEPIDVSPELDGAGWTGYLQDGGRAMRLPEGGTWLECADPDRVLVLARHVVMGADPEAMHRAAERARTEAELRELERSRAEEAAAQARRAEELRRAEEARLQAEAARRAEEGDAPQ
jgi:hypothetical protein